VGENSRKEYGDEGIIDGDEDGDFVGVPTATFLAV
jgi:hypothetical protein